jgi:hypothetical protein
MAYCFSEPGEGEEERQKDLGALAASEDLARRLSEFFTEKNETF